MSTIIGLLAGIAFFIFEVASLGDLSDMPIEFLIAYAIPPLFAFIIVKSLIDKFKEPEITPEQQRLLDSIKNLPKYGNCTCCGTYIRDDYKNKEGIFCYECFMKKIEEDKKFNVCDKCGDQQTGGLLLKDGVYVCPYCYCGEKEDNNQ